MPAARPVTSPDVELTEAKDAPEMTDHESLLGVRRTPSPLSLVALAERVTDAPTFTVGLAVATAKVATELSMSIEMPGASPPVKVIWTVLAATTFPLASRASLVTSWAPAGIPVILPLEAGLVRTSSPDTGRLALARTVVRTVSAATGTILPLVGHAMVRLREAVVGVGVPEVPPPPPPQPMRANNAKSPARLAFMALH